MSGLAALLAFAVDDGLDLRRAVYPAVIIASTV
jgi:hypothetical protein